MIHQFATVHPEAQIGQNVEIGPYVTIEKDVVIGDGTKVMSGAVILDGARIGRNCRIFPYAIIAGIPQDLKFHGEKTTCEIGDNNDIREFATIHRGTASKGKTVVGNGNLIMTYTHIGHDCVFGNNIIVSNSCQFAGEVHVDDFAVIGGGSLVHQFTHVGSYVMIQGGSRFGKDVPPFAMIGREPARYQGINIVGMKRHNYTSEQIRYVQDIYKYFYDGGLNTTQAIEAVEKEIEASPLRDMIINFIKTSERGVIQ